MFVIQKKTKLHEFLQVSTVGLLWVDKDEATEFADQGDAYFFLSAKMLKNYAMVVAK